MKIKDILLRALKTFVQSFLGALIVTLPTTDLTNLVVLKSVLVGALAAGISGVMNVYLIYINKHSENNSNIY